MSSRIAIVARDPDLRLMAAKAFDSAPTDWTVRLFDDAPPDADAIVVCGDTNTPGIRFEPHRPQKILVEVASALERSVSGRSVGVVGACGGAGTTTIALHLSQALARHCSTCYVELDRNRGARHRLGLSNEAPTWADIDGGRDSILRAALPVEGSFRVLLRPEIGMDPGADLIERCDERFSRLIVDGGEASRNDPQVHAGMMIMVLPPTIVGAHRARELMSQAPDPAWVVVANRLGPGSETTRGVLEGALERRIDLELPCTPALRDREDEFRLLVSPWSRWLRRIDRLAAALIER